MVFRLSFVLVFCILEHIMFDRFILTKILGRRPQSEILTFSFALEH